MSRHVATALVFFVAFLIVLAEIGRMHDEASAKIEQQRSLNAHQ